jgi:hypothetical protein
MSGRWLVGAVLLAAVASGCKGQLNHAYCAEHPEDSDCRDAGLVRIDAPRPECESSAACTTDPSASVCDLDAKTCVECTSVEQQACTTRMMYCGDDRKCHGCLNDSHCASRVCLSSQTCAMESGVVYAQPTGSGTACSLAAPCALATAVEQLTATRSILKMTTTAQGMTGMLYDGPPLRFSQAFAVQLIATGTTFTPTGDGDAITAAGQSLEVFGLTITGSRRSGIGCTNSALILRRVHVLGSADWGVAGTGCSATIERSRFQSNVDGGISLAGGTHELRNNIIDRNGDTTLEQGNVRLTDVRGRFVFNTIAYNQSRTGGSRTSGVQCTAAGAGFTVSRNILAENGAAGRAISGTCTAVGNFITGTATEVRFNNPTELRLTAQSPEAAVRDDPDADAECQRDGTYIDDFQGEARPVVFCDKGADEFRP